MSKKNTKVAMELTSGEQTTLRLLLGLREQANASAAAASAGVRNYLIQLLTTRGLDPQKWGVSPDMTTFTEIKRPEAPPAPDPASVSAAAVATPPTNGKETFAEGQPAPAPADQSAAPAAA